MPLRNRVTPEGEIIADPSRGDLMGNRGHIHRPDKTLGVARWATRAWIACTLDFKGRHRTEMMAPGSYTELFFRDETTAYAAGHRPCAECRRTDYLAFRDLWADLFGAASAPAIDAALHAARVTRDRRKVVFRAVAIGLPDCTMIRTPEGPAVILGDILRPWHPSGYGPPQVRPRGHVQVLTPAPVVEMLRAGLPSALHHTAA